MVCTLVIEKPPLTEASESRELRRTKAISWTRRKPLGLDVVLMKDSMPIFYFLWLLSTFFFLQYQNHSYNEALSQAERTGRIRVRWSNAGVWRIRRYVTVKVIIQIMVSIKNHGMLMKQQSIQHLHLQFGCTNLRTNSKSKQNKRSDSTNNNSMINAW